MCFIMFELSWHIRWVCDNIYPHLHWIQSQLTSLSPSLASSRARNSRHFGIQSDIMHFFCYRSWVKRFFKHELYSSETDRERRARKATETSTSAKENYHVNFSTALLQRARTFENGTAAVCTNTTTTAATAEEGKILCFQFLSVAAIKMWKFLFMHF